MKAELPAARDETTAEADDAGLSALRELVAAPAGRFRQRPAPGPAAAPRTLTVGMSTYDDYDGVYFTVSSLLLYHPEVMDRVDFLVVDNHPTGPHAWALKRLEEEIPQLRYVPYDRRVGTAARDRVFREAVSDWVLCVDSHVQLPAGALAALLDYIDEHPDSGDLIQGPLVSTDGRTVSTHWEPRWERCMFGVWGTDPRGIDPAAPPFEIGLQGLGLFACRTKAWPGLSPAFTGHGGEEGHLHEKFRRAGHTVQCLPALRWTHRFDVSRPTRPHHTWTQRLRNYLVGFDELGLPADEALDHFTGLLGEETVQEVLAGYETEKRNPFSSFDGITCLNLDDRPDRWQEMARRLRALGIPAERVHRQAATATPANHHVGCALSHRRAVEQAHRDGLESLLVLEDDAVFLLGTTWVLRRALAELAARPWSLLYLGGFDWGRSFPRAEGCHHLEPVSGITTTHAIAYHRSVFARLLDELPDTVEGMAAWIQQHTALDQYLGRWDRPDCYRTVPVVAAQTDQIPLVAEDLRDQFAL
ncbi:hypothetical protein P3T27_004969 [Kitasatospora sp. MAA19]|uniref:glycosyltransferase n=1 Tax=unclassified Kitasatospora TaxID=2633591 RepID=UPI002473781F|nr:glycosyltransferase [Kitasatospora sp. MAA19]MDH6708230.1 hypothetical protein [Kitasatospora sp. MAA19]